MEKIKLGSVYLDGTPAKPGFKYGGSSKVSIGAEISLIGPVRAPVTGKLVSCTDYDLVLETAIPLPDICKWAVLDGKQLIVDRARVVWLKEV